jgi:hypothetical protein
VAAADAERAAAHSRDECMGERTTPSRNLRETRLIGILLAIAFGTVVAAVTVHNTVFIAELGVPGSTATKIVVLYAARQLNVSPTEVVDMMRSSRNGQRGCGP